MFIFERAIAVAGYCRKMRWQFVIVILLPICKGNSQRSTLFWTDDFRKVLFSMKGPEWAGLRSKLITEITLTRNGDRIRAHVECPEWLLSVLEMLNCKNTTRRMENKLQYMQFFSAYNSDPKVLDSLIQQNCSQIPHKYVQPCQMTLANKINPYPYVSELISHLGECYEESKRTTNISLTYRY